MGSGKTIKAPACAEVIAANALPNLSGACTSATWTSTPSDCAAAFVCSRIGAVLGFNGFDKTATRASLGTISVRSWSRLPLSSGAWRLNPVMFPPGRLRFATKPVPTGSALVAMTIGTVCVTVFAAWIAAVLSATMTSQSSQLGSDRRKRVLSTLGKTVLDDDVLPFDPAVFLQALRKCLQRTSHVRAALVARQQKAKPAIRLGRMLRARRESPRGCRAAAPSNVTCHAPLPRRHAQSNNITSLFDHSRQLRAGRDTSAEPSTSGRSRASSNRFVCAIGRRDAAQARSATSVINRTDAVQDTRRFRPQPFAGAPQSPYR